MSAINATFSRKGRKDADHASCEDDDEDGDGQHLEDEEHLTMGAERRPWLSRLLIAAAACWILFHILVGGLGFVPGYQLRAIHVGGALALVFAWRPLGKRALWPLDLLLAAGAIISSGYLVICYDQIVSSSWFINAPVDRVMGTVMFVCVIEGVRRVLGGFFIGLIAVFVAYAVLGQFIPGMFGHNGFTADRLVYSFYMGNQGVTGMLIGISAGVVALFMIFGEVLTASGGGDTFINVAMRLGGRYRGGAGMVAVIASGFMGMINGSAVANVTSTGVLTIPLMRRLGFGRNLAGAIEAVASTGGQFMPPIMGPGAFLMAELLGISYLTVATAALIPSLLFYFGLLLNVWIFSRARGLQPIPEEMIPSRAVTYAPWAMISLIAPVTILIGMVVSGYTVQLAAFWAIVISSGLVVWHWALARLRASAARRPVAAAGGPDAASTSPAGSGPVATPAPVPVPVPAGAFAAETAALAALVRRSAGGVAFVAMIILSSQIIVAIINLTGLGVTFSELVVALGEGNIVLSLVLTMLVTFILGMGMPTPAAYAVAAAVLAAPLTRLGFESLPTHLFLYYFACLAAITPPVAAAIFAAISISGGRFLSTAAYSMMLSLGLYIVPFLFIQDPVLIMEGRALDILTASVTAGLGVGVLSFASIGWCRGPLSWGLRLLLCAAAFLMLVPGVVTDLVGLTVAAGLILPRLLRPVATGGPE